MIGEGDRMNDLISRQDAIREMIVKVNGFQREGHEPVLQYAGELIRCKDCKYYRWESDMCDYPYATAQNVVHEDDFCSKAERRKENVSD